MLVRGLWGMEIEPSKNYIIVSNASFRISMATLNSFDDPGRTSVFIAFQDKEFKLCSLIPEKIEQQVIDITCLEGEKTVLRSEGPNCIHLTGNYVSLYDSDSEEESEDAGSDRKPGSEAGTITSNYTGEELIEENLSASEELGAVENENVEESFKMPIIYEYLDSLLQHDSTANAKFYNQQANVNSISQRNGRRTISTQKQESIEKDYSDTEISRSSEENDDTSTSTSDSEQNTKDIIVIPSEQTSDVESNDETSTTESDYKSCDEERRNEVEEIPYSEERIIIGKEKIEEIKDKDEGLEQIDGIKKIKEEQVEEPKALDLSYQIESESGDDNEESMNVDTKTDGKKSWPKMLDQKVNHDKSRSTIENNNALKKGNAKEKRTKVKVVIPIVERAKSPKSSSTPDVKSSNETIKTKVQKKKESVASAPTNAKANGNVKYDLAAPSNNNVKKVPTPNNNAKNDKASANKTAAKYPISQTSSRPSNRGGRKMAESSKTPTTPSKANGDKNSSQSKADDKSVTAQISTPQKGKDKDTQLKRRRALDDEKSTNEKSSVSRQSSVDTEIRYPKRKRAPDFERNLEFMAKEDAKMARRIGNHSAKRKKSPKTSSKSSQQ